MKTARQASTLTVGRQAFTLLEVLIGTLSVAILLLALHTTFYAAMRLRSSATRKADHLIPMNQALAILRRDLRGLLPTNRLAVPLVGRPPGNGPDGSSFLEFSTTTGILSDEAPWAEVQKVAYYLREAEDADTQTNGLEWVRMVSRNVLPTTTETVQETPLLGGLERLEFGFYDGTTWQNSWGSNTSSTATIPLPLAIRVSLQFANQDYRFRGNEPLEVVVPLTIYVNTNQTTSASGQATGGGG